MWSRAALLGCLSLAACAEDPVVDLDAGGVDAGVVDAAPAPPPPIALRLEAAPATIEGRPWPSDHWRDEEGWRLPVIEDDEGFFHVTMRQIQARLDGYALRPVGRFCFTQDLPLSPPPADLIQLVDASEQVQELTQITIDRERRCVQFAAAAPLRAGATYYSMLKKAPGDWDIILLAGATPSQDALAVDLASRDDILAAEPFTIQSVGGALAARRASIVDGRAWDGEIPSLEVLHRQEATDLLNGNFFGIEAGRRGFYLRLHVADFVADESGQLVLEDELVFDMNRLSATSAALLRSVETGDQQYAQINRDWSLSAEMEAPAGTVVQAFQELFMPMQSYAELDGQLDSNFGELIYAQVDLPVWRNDLGILAELTESGVAPGGVQTVQVNVFLPKGERPEQGWPVVLLGPGYAGLRHDLWVVADALCAAGFAAVMADAAGHGGGPATEMQLPIVNGLPVTVVTPGRAIDRNADGRYGSPEGLHASWAAPEFAGMVGMHDGNRQTVLDLSALLTVLLPDAERGQTGADLDGDGQADFDPALVSYVGHSNGGRYGMTFAAHEPRLKRAVLMAPPGDGYIPYISTYRDTWAELFDTWMPPITNTPSGRYGLFDEGILWPGAGLLDAPLWFHEINRFTARRAWLAGDAEGEGAAALWRQKRALGEPRAEVMVQLVQGDPAVVNPDSMRLVDAAGDDMTLALINPDATGWRDSMRFSDLLFRHLIPVYESRAAYAPGALARLARDQAVAFIASDEELDLDGEEDALSLLPNRRELRFLLGFSFWELRQLLRF